MHRKINPIGMKMLQVLIYKKWKGLMTREKVSLHNLFKLFRMSLQRWILISIWKRVIFNEMRQWNLIFSVWKSNIGKYPILEIVAQDILGIPVSTMAFKSAFSTGGHVIHYYRN